jgi:hypothetical protein
MTCAFGHDDAAYVLGSLSPGDRLAFEHHLESCADCTRGVRELAGMPGLLARVPAGLGDSLPTGGPVPDTLLPSLVREVRRRTRRRAWLTAGVAAAATALVVSAGALTVSTFRDGGTPPTATPTSSGSGSATVAPAMVMDRVGQEGVDGQLTMTSVAWGTRLELTCTYAAGDGAYELPPGSTYAMFVRTREGRVERVASWRSLPGRTMQLAAATATTRDDISTVVVRTDEGQTVLRLVI